MSVAMEIPNSRWEILVKRAQSDLERVRSELRAAQQRLHALEASLLRIDAMIGEYEQRIAALREVSRRISDEYNVRRFLDQLHAVRARAVAETSLAQREVDKIAVRVAERERERLKLEALLASEQDAARTRRSLAEQRRSDEWSLTGYRSRDL